MAYSLEDDTLRPEVVQDLVVYEYDDVAFHVRGDRTDHIVSPTGASSPTTSADGASPSPKRCKGRAPSPSSKVMVDCAVCGKTVERYRCHVKRVKEVLCSATCVGKRRIRGLLPHAHKGRSAWTDKSLASYREKMTGERNPAWRGGAMLAGPEGQLRGSSLRASAGRVPLRKFFRGMHYLVLPCISQALLASAIIARMTRSTMLEVLRQEYMTTARGKGLPKVWVVGKHALKNAFAPTLTVIGFQLGNILGGAVINETIFSLPGIGQLIYTAIGQREYPIVQGCILLTACGFVIINLVVDLLYSYFDPRIVYEG